MRAPFAWRRADSLFRAGRSAHGWLDWLAPWASYRTEIEKLIDLGERVVVIVRDYGRRELGAPEVDLMSGAVWTVRDGMIVRAEFFANRGDALASVGLAE